MKQFISYMLAGFIGGAVAFYAFDGTRTVSWEENQSPKALMTSTYDGAVVHTPFNFTEAAELVTPAVVHIMAEESKALASQKKRDNPFGGLFDFGELFGPDFFGPKEGAGSGVIISEDGYIVTNNHVVGFADEIKVALPDKREFTAELVGTDPRTDIALLKIDATGLKYVEFGDSDDIRVGEWVAAIGNPFSYLKSTVTAGIVSAKGRDIDIIKDEKAIEEFIQTDAAINPGNSGGALVTPDGKLIGINTAIATPTGVFAGYSFAVPSNLVQKVIDDIKEHGDMRRAQLGIAGDSVDDELIDQRNLSVTKGFYVAKLEPGSAAQLAGVLPGDVIIAANGQKIDNYEDLVEVMAFAKVGDTVELEVQRKNKVEEISVRLRKGI